MLQSSHTAIFSRMTTCYIKLIMYPLYSNSSNSCSHLTATMVNLVISAHTRFCPSSLHYKKRIRSSRSLLAAHIQLQFEMRCNVNSELLPHCCCLSWILELIFPCRFTKLVAVSQRLSPVTVQIPPTGSDWLTLEIVLKKSIMNKKPALVKATFLNSVCVWWIMLIWQPRCNWKKNDHYENTFSNNELFIHNVIGIFYICQSCIPSAYISQCCYYLFCYNYFEAP